MVSDEAHLWNDRPRLEALKRLVGALPDATAPVPEREPGPKHRIAKRLKELVEVYQAGPTVYELGERFGIERRTVSKILKREGVETRWRRLTEEDIDEAVRLYATGLSAARIADRFKVDSETVRYQLRKHGVRMRGPHERGL